MNLRVHDLMLANTTYSLLNYQVIIVTDPPAFQELIALDSYCHNHQIYFIFATTKGIFGQCFTDFGDKFIINDPLGEQSIEQMIKCIRNNEEGTVEIIDGVKCQFAEGDIVEMREVKEEVQKGQKSFNGMEFVVKKVEENKFLIGDTRGFNKYMQNGIAKQVIKPLVQNFNTLDLYCKGDIIFDPQKQNLLSWQLLQENKLEQQVLMHYCFLQLNMMDLELINSEPCQTYQLFLKAFEQNYLNLVLQRLQVKSKVELKFYEQILILFVVSLYGKYPPIDAFMGGIVAQEAIKAITKKFTPINQFYYYNCLDLIEFDQQYSLQLFQKLSTLLNKNDFLKILLGEALFTKLQKSRIFQIGAGALGCELLKNYAMLSVSCKDEGQLIIADPDLIENSNLSRQFLFREKHMQKPKSSTAAASILQMNPDLKGHLEARLDKLDQSTTTLYDEKFFQGLDIVSNGLDNIAARRFIDAKCVQARTRLIDSGTLGSKGHVQVIIPWKTESYSSQQDPEDNQQIPQCTLKLFPEEPVHCIEWALSKFNDYFMRKSENFNRVEELVKTESVEWKVVNSAVKRMALIERVGVEFANCVKEAIRQFNKYFYWNIAALLKAYPENMTDKITGEPFWKLPRRLPMAMEFNPVKNVKHFEFVLFFGNLLAEMLGVERKVLSVQEVEQLGKEIAGESQKENGKIIQKIVKQVEKQKGQSQQEQIEVNEGNDIKSKLNKLKLFYSKNKTKQLPIIQFEKDNDNNFHIDLLHSMANCRSFNYHLAETSWLDVKLKAGKFKLSKLFIFLRITPAMVTTTAVIAALQTMELVKILCGRKVEACLNSFLNLAIPNLVQSEPSPAKKYLINQSCTVDLWDRLNIIVQFIFNLDGRFNYPIIFKLYLKLGSILKRNTHLRRKMYSMGDNLFISMLQYKIRLKVRLFLTRKLKRFLYFFQQNKQIFQQMNEKEKYIDLTITFTILNSNQIINNLPIIRIYFQ